jgi:hypothetical protein
MSGVVSSTSPMKRSEMTRIERGSVNAQCRFGI